VAIPVEPGGEDPEVVVGPRPDDSGILLLLASPCRFWVTRVGLPCAKMFPLFSFVGGGVVVGLPTAPSEGAEVWLLSVRTC